MSETPERCPTCRTVLPDGVAQCPACGRVLGEGNRCPHCSAIAGVLQRGGKTVCAACGRPRVGAVVVGSPARARDPATRAMVARADGRMRRAIGGASIALGLLMALMAALILPGMAGIVVPLIMALLGGGAGALGLSSGAKRIAAANRVEREAHERKVVALARTRSGRLTAAEVAKSLSISEADADDVLTGLVGDGSKVDVDVDDEGEVIYVFRDLIARAAPVRVEVDATATPVRGASSKTVDASEVDAVAETVSANEVDAVDGTVRPERVA